MTANPQSFSADSSSTPEHVHETNYAIEVLEKEYPATSRSKIAQAIATARSNATPAADRWRILQQARLVLSNR